MHFSLATSLFDFLRQHISSTADLVIGEALIAKIEVKYIHGWQRPAGTGLD
ncbi:MAG: hypothetical protein KZQ95_00355 [Candidatus Thiodiazotropha sp. (ex Epidulcina cf. delphinae)]|nr:hypothetical protein [Candidatus Thiodiazotropha sp. (ex Epidulcina cf. delphinae)]